MRRVEVRQIRVFCHRLPSLILFISETHFNVDKGDAFYILFVEFNEDETLSSSDSNQVSDVCGIIVVILPAIQIYRFGQESDNIGSSM